jgi:mannose-6-phosphate isomerase-like protein (cupin superfamily)
MRTMKPYLILLAAGIAVILNSGCGEQRAHIVTSQLNDVRAPWTPEQLAAQQATYVIPSQGGTSAQILRLGGTMLSQVHDAHDLTVVVLSGSAYVRLGGRFHAVKPGDVIQIPRGNIYYFENRGGAASEFYELYYPAYDGKDLRMVKEGEDALSH